VENNDEGKGFGGGEGRIKRKRPAMHCGPLG
jgi:hypothetical protein